MQIFTRQGVYDSKMVNKMKQCLYKKALFYHGSRVDNTVLAFIMSQLLYSYTPCDWKIESLYLRRWEMRGKKTEKK